MNQIILSIENISKEIEDFGQKILILDKVTFQVKQSEIVAITGPSGCGKSSLLYILGLIDNASAGELIIDSINTNKLSESEKASLRLSKIGYIFQFHFLIAEFTCLENVMLPMLRLGQISAQEAKEYAKYLLVKLGLENRINYYPHQLSGGQRQRVAIARSLANKPQIILADEPTGSLDSKNAANVMEIFAELNNDFKQTLVIVTHDNIFAKCAHREIKMLDGKVSRAI